MAQARAVKFCTEGDYIKSCQRDYKSPLKEVWFLLTWPIFVYTTVELEKILHGTQWTAISNVVDDGLLIIARLMVDASAAIHYGLISISSICHPVRCKLACIIYIDNKSIKFEYYLSNMW